MNRRRQKPTHPTPRSADLEPEPIEVTEFSGLGAWGSLIGWTALTAAAVLSGLLPAGFAVAGAAMGLVAFRHQRRAAQARAVPVILVHTLMVNIPLLALLAVLAGFALRPGHAMQTAGILAVPALLAAGGGALLRIRKGTLPASFALDDARSRVALSKLRLPRPIEWGVMIVGLLVLALHLAGVEAGVRGLSAPLLLAIIVLLALGPIASWLAAAVLLRRMERRDGKAIRLA